LLALEHARQFTAVQENCAARTAAQSLTAQRGSSQYRASALSLTSTTTIRPIAHSRESHARSDR
jgi:hypothetical protein